jgi:PAS domain S-box-containing protein
VADERSLLETLLEYTLSALDADHATFCEVENSPEVITVVAASGILTDPEVLPGMGPLVSDDLGYDGAPETEESRVGIYRRGDPNTPGVTAFLDRIGCAFDVTIRIFQDDVRTHLLEVYWVDDRPFGPPEVARAEQLALLLETVISRDRLTLQLAQAETRFRTLVQQIPAIPYVSESPHQATFLSPAITRLLSPGVEPLPSGAWTDALHAADRARVVAAFERHFETGEPYDEEYRLIDAEGAVHWFHDRATLLPATESSPARSHGVMFDVTERHQAEEALRRSEQSRQQVLEAMLHAEAAARAQIAGELHDDTIQVMTAALLAVERASLASVAASSPDPRLTAALDAACATLQTAVERARRLTFELRPPLLDAKGVAAALRDLVEEVEREGGFEATLDAPAGRFPYTVEDLAFRTVKEALSNTRKHADARHVEVQLWSDGDWLHGKLTDDGRGFDVERALDRRGMRLHLGLDAMRERLRLAGGDVRITSAPGEGTELEFAIPIAEG